MHVVIIEPDEITGHLLAFAARRRGHGAAHVRTVRDLPQPMPFEPSAFIVAPEGVNRSSLADFERLRERYPEAIHVMTPERVDGSLGVTALTAGFADVIAKPYHPHEVILRTERSVRTLGDTTAPEGTTRIADLEVNLDRYTARKAGHSLNLTRLELRLLVCLMQNHGHLTPHDQLLSFGWWDMGDPNPSLLKTHVSHLRTKLEAVGGAPFRIRSRHSLGYVLEFLEEDSVEDDEDDEE